MLRRLVILALALALGCAADRSATPVSSEALRGARVEIVRTLSTSPEGGDGPALVELRVTDARGRRHLFAPMVGGSPWQDGALLLGPQGELFFGDAAGARTLLDENVAFVPVVSPRGDHFAYATSEDGLAFSLVSRSANERVTLGEGLASIGAVRFVEDERFVMTAGRPGGVAGLFVASTSSLRLATCLTNCALRTGQPWGVAFVPLPSDLESVTLDGDVLSYADASGALRTVAFPRAVP